MSNRGLGVNSYNEAAYPRQSVWPPMSLQDPQSTQPMQAPHASAGGGPYDTSYSYDPRMACLGMSSVVDDRRFFQRTPGPGTCYSPFNSSEGSSNTRPSSGMDSDFVERSAVSSPSSSVISHVGSSGLRTEIGVSTQASSAGIACERAPVSVRDVRKRAHDLSKRLDTAAQKAADDQEANLSILAFSARSDTKDHPNNTPHLFASPSIVKAFHKRGVSDIKSYLTDMAYETGNDEEIPTPQLVATLKQQVSSLTERVSDLSRLEHENAVLKEEIELLRRVAEGHAVVAAKLQEAMSISNDYSFYAGQPSTSGQH